MLDAKLGRPLGLDLGQMSEVVAKPLRTPPVKPRPKRRLRHRHTAALGHALVVVGNAGDHVNVGVDVEGHRDRLLTSVTIGDAVTQVVVVSILSDFRAVTSSYCRSLRLATNIDLGRRSLEIAKQGRA